MSTFLPPTSPLRHGPAHPGETWEPSQRSETDRLREEEETQTWRLTGEKVVFTLTSPHLTQPGENTEQGRVPVVGDDVSCNFRLFWLDQPLVAIPREVTV